MEEIITKGNLDTYTQGLKGVLSSMGEAILSAGSGSSEDIADIKSVVDDIYDVVTSTVTYLSIELLLEEGNSASDFTVTVSDATLNTPILAQQDGKYAITTGHEYIVEMTPNQYIPYIGGTAHTSVGTASSYNLLVLVDYKHMPECVDLGNGILWATGNLTKDANDAYSIADQTEYGAYFSWGNTNGQRVAGQTDSYSFNSTTYSSTTGKNLTANFTSGDATYDAARARLGSPWRIPTYDELDWLKNNCTWNWKASGNTDYNGVAGYEVVGTNGNKIFLPCAGDYSGTSLSRVGSKGNYWSTRYNSSDFAYLLSFDSGNKGSSIGSRYAGYSVRPVR